MNFDGSRAAMRAGPHPRALRLDSLRSLAAAAGATHAAGANLRDNVVSAETNAGRQVHKTVLETVGLYASD
jgi:hypothetical protein